MDLRARILVVEDEPDIRRFARLALEPEGHEAFEAATLERGLIEAGSRRPDLVIVDLGLPDGDGVDPIRDPELVERTRDRALARSGEADKIAALDAGADDYLVKPFGAGELLARVRAIATAVPDPRRRPTRCPVRPGERRSRRRVVERGANCCT